MLFCFLNLAHTAELSPQSLNDQSTGALQMQTDESPTPFVDPLAKLQAKKQRLCWLQTASTITDYTCQFTQVALTIPQLTSNPSENTGVWPYHKFPQKNGFKRVWWKQKMLSLGCRQIPLPLYNKVAYFPYPRAWCFSSSVR